MGDSTVPPLSVLLQGGEKLKVSSLEEVGDKTEEVITANLPRGTSISHEEKRGEGVISDSPRGSPSKPSTEKADEESAEEKEDVVDGEGKMAATTGDSGREEPSLNGSGDHKVDYSQEEIHEWLSQV